MPQVLMTYYVLRFHRFHVPVAAVRLATLTLVSPFLFA